MLKIALLATATMVAVASPAFAALNPNGLNPNGLNPNGLNPNAMNPNALHPNGFEAANTIRVNGASFSLGGVGGMSVIRVELPR